MNERTVLGKAPSIMISSIMRRRLVWRDIRLYVCLIRRSLAGDISDFSSLIDCWVIPLDLCPEYGLCNTRCACVSCAWIRRCV